MGEVSAAIKEILADLKKGEDIRWKFVLQQIILFLLGLFKYLCFYWVFSRSWFLAGLPWSFASLQARTHIFEKLTKKQENIGNKPAKTNI